MKLLGEVLAGDFQSPTTSTNYCMVACSQTIFTLCTPRQPNAGSVSRRTSCYIPGHIHHQALSWYTHRWPRRALPVAEHKAWLRYPAASEADCRSRWQTNKLQAITDTCSTASSFHHMIIKLFLWFRYSLIASYSRSLLSHCPAPWLV